MEEAISAADANRKFSQVLRDVRDGRIYVVTSHGKPVAKIVPVSKESQVTLDARKALLTRLRGELVKKIGRWTRRELYEDTP